MKKFKKVIKKIQNKNIDAFLITNLNNIKYLTGFKGSNAQILITKSNIFFITDGRYLEEAKGNISPEIKLQIYRESFEDTIRLLSSKENLKSLGFESKNLTFFQYKKLVELLKIKIVPMDDIIEDFRKIKSKKEINYIKKAIEISENSLKNILNKVDLKVITEKEFAILLEQEMIKGGAEDKSFSTIVLAGKKTSLVHGKPGNLKLNKKILLVDFGCFYKNYASDKTVTLIFWKKNNDMKKIFNIVKDAKNYAIEKIKPGVKAKDIDRVAREYIDKKGFGKYFLHSLGHGIGIEIHEKPTISYLSEEILEPGMVFTIEPGIYIENKFGIRLEDVVALDSHGSSILTEPSEKF